MSDLRLGPWVYDRFTCLLCVGTGSMGVTETESTRISQLRVHGPLTAERNGFVVNSNSTKTSFAPNCTFDAQLRDTRWYLFGRRDGVLLRGSDVFHENSVLVQ